MKKYTVYFYILLAVSIILALISYIFLPETVITQISLKGSASTTMPKIFAIALPFALSAGPSALCLFNRDSKVSSKKCLLLSVIGIVIFAIMLFVNLSAK